LSGALIASFYLGEFSLSGISIRGTLTSLLFFTGFSLYFGFVDPMIDNGCHIGGLVSGLALGAVIARTAPQSDAPLRRAAVVGVVAVAVLAAGLGVRQWRGTPMRLARQYQELMEKGDTIGRYQMIVKQQPNSVPARLALAAAYFNQQKFSEAEAEFKRVLSLDPGNVSAKFELGLTYLNEKRPQEAQAAFSDLLAQDNTKAQAHYGLGLVLEDQGKCQAAIEEFKAVLLADPSAIDVHQELGNCYSQLNRHDDAIAAYLRQKEAGSDTPELENGLARSYQAKGMTKEAEEAKERALKLRGGSR
jgi:tetratricopeptide (TPR) repeat protein